MNTLTAIEFVLLKLENSTKILLKKRTNIQILLLIKLFIFEQKIENSGPTF